MIISTRIRLDRNLANFPLGPGVTNEQRNEIEAKVTKALEKLEGETVGNYFPLHTMTDE